MAWVSSQKDFRRSEPETIDIQLRVARRSERLRHRIGCRRAISLPSLSNYANSGIVSQCGLASDTGLERLPVVGAGGRGKALLGMISALLDGALEQALESQQMRPLSERTINPRLALKSQDFSRRLLSKVTILLTVLQRCPIAFDSVARWSAMLKVSGRDLELGMGA